MPAKAKNRSGSTERPLRPPPSTVFSHWLVPRQTAPAGHLAPWGERHPYSRGQRASCKNLKARRSAADRRSRKMEDFLDAAKNKLGESVEGVAPGRCGQGRARSARRRSACSRRRRAPTSRVMARG